VGGRVRAPKVRESCPLAQLLILDFGNPVNPVKVFEGLNIDTKG